MKFILALLVGLMTQFSQAQISAPPPPTRLIDHMSVIDLRSPSSYMEFDIAAPGAIKPAGSQSSPDCLLLVSNIPQSLLPQALQIFHNGVAIRNSSDARVILEPTLLRGLMPSQNSIAGVIYYLKEQNGRTGTLDFWSIYDMPLNQRVQNAFGNYSAQLMYLRGCAVR